MSALLREETIRKNSWTTSSVAKKKKELVVALRHDCSLVIKSSCYDGRFQQFPQHPQQFCTAQYALVLLAVDARIRKTKEKLSPDFCYGRLYFIFNVLVSLLFHSAVCVSVACLNRHLFQH